MDWPSIILLKKKMDNPVTVEGLKYTSNLLKLDKTHGWYKCIKCYRENFVQTVSNLHNIVLENERLKFLKIENNVLKSIKLQDVNRSKVIYLLIEVSFRYKFKIIKDRIYDASAEINLKDKVLLNHYPDFKELNLPDYKKWRKINELGRMMFNEEYCRNDIFKNFEKLKEVTHKQPSKKKIDEILKC